MARSVGTAARKTKPENGTEANGVENNAGATGGVAQKLTKATKQEM
jgi:hypothetical protein